MSRTSKTESTHHVDRMNAVVWKHPDAAIGVVTKIGEFQGQALLVTHAAGKLYSMSRSRLQETCSPLLDHTPLSVEEAGFYPLDTDEPGPSIG